MTPEDREMLEMAARAAGILVEDYKGHMAIVESDGESNWRTGEYWSPLEDDGDALRLAVRLGIQITPGTYNPDKFCAFCAEAGECVEFLSYKVSRLDATRLAIVKTAAAIGRSMP